MSFPESIRQAVLKRAHFHCCVCQKTSVSIEVHHITPRAHGGEDSEDNAAPLCPTCHADVGDNPIKRKAIKDRRDWWYEICLRREEPTGTWIAFADKIDTVATKNDLTTLGKEVANELISIISQPEKGIFQIKRELSSFTGTLGSMAPDPPRPQGKYPAPDDLKSFQVVRTSSGAASDYSYGIFSIAITSPSTVYKVSAVGYHDEVRVWPLRTLPQIGPGKTAQLQLRVEWVDRGDAPDVLEDSYRRTFPFERPRDPGPPWAPLFVTFELPSGELWAAITYFRIDRQQKGHPESNLLYGPAPFAWLRGNTSPK